MFIGHTYLNLKFTANASIFPNKISFSTIKVQFYNNIKAQNGEKTLCGWVFPFNVKILARVSSRGVIETIRQIQELGIFLERAFLGFTQIFKGCNLVRLNLRVSECLCAFIYFFIKYWGLLAIAEGWEPLGNRHPAPCLLRPWYEVIFSREPITHMSSWYHARDFENGCLPHNPRWRH